jgi:hypothetical protein
LPHSLVLHALIALAFVALWQGHRAQVARQDSADHNRAVQEVKQSAAEMKAQVEEMQKIRDSVQALSQKREKEYAEAAREAAKKAQPEALELLQKAAQSQETARQAMEKLAEADQKRAETFAQWQQATEAERAAKQGEFEQAKRKAQEIIEASTKAQKESEEQQKRALDQLGFAGQAFEPVREALKKVVADQQAVSAVQEPMARFWETEAKERAAQQEAEEVRRREKPVAEVEEKKNEKLKQQGEAQQAMEQQRQKLEEIKKRLEEARAKAQQENTPENQEAVKKLEQELREAEARMRQIRGEQERWAREVDQQQKYLENQVQPSLQRAKDQLAAADKNLGEWRSQRQQSTQTVKEGQARIAGVQQQVLQQFQDMANGAPAISTEAAAALPPVQAAVIPAGEMTAEQAYEAARQLEREMAEWHRHQRAAELALIQRITIQEAYNILPSDGPTRANFAASGLQLEHLQSSQDVAKFREVFQNMQFMLAHAHDMKSGQGEGTEFFLDWTKDRDAADARMVGRAGRGSGQAVDLTGLMGSGTGDGDGGGGSQGEGPRVAPMHDTYARKAEDGSARAPVLTSGQVKTVPGRRVGSGGLGGAEWMAVDTWYLIGPFANPGRANRNLRFPPEEQVDLDAVYPGQNGKPLRWQFIQTTKAGFWPEQQVADAVFYAYTELWFEEAQDLWITMGCDDNATIWLEGQLIYTSADQYKAWSFSEAMRRVHFKKGLNRVLYRIENGPRVVAFSMAVYLGASPPAQ